MVRKTTQAFWPPYPARARERTLAVARPRGDLLVEGLAVLPCSSWEEFSSAMERLNLEVLIESWGGWAWWADAAADPRSFVVHGEGRKVRALVWQGKRKRFWIVNSKVWANRHADRSLCRDLQQVAKATGMGQWGTPSRLGDALQRRAWKRTQGWRWESRPPMPVRRQLLEEGVGGRAETLHQGSRFTGIWEIDQRDAYAAAWRLPKPSGPPGIGVGVVEDARAGRVAFGKVRFTIEQDLQCLGPFAIRTAEGLQWPTRAGSYLAEVWSPEVLDAISCGIRCDSVGTSQVWHRMVSEESWSEELSEIRRQAGGWGSVLKVATVAAIGRHGRKPQAYGEASPGSPDAFGYGPGNSRMYELKQTDPASMTHWYAWAIMQARRKVWHRAVAEEWAGRRVIAVETDALILDGSPMGPVVPRGDDTLGEWSIRRADCEVWTPMLRWAFFGDGSARTPGLPDAMRASWLAAHAPPL